MEPPDHTPRPGVLSGRIGSIADAIVHLIADDGRRIGVRVGGIDARKGRTRPVATTWCGLLPAALEIEPIKTGLTDARWRGYVLAGKMSAGQIEAGLAWHFALHADQSPRTHPVCASPARRDRRARCGPITPVARGCIGSAAHRRQPDASPGAPIGWRVSA
jgi:hypothetical protein